MEYIVYRNTKDKEWSIQWYPGKVERSHTDRAAKEETILNHIAGVQVGKDKYILPFNSRYINDEQYWRSIITNDNQSDKNYKERYYNYYLNYIEELLPLTFYKNLIKEETDNTFLYLKDNLTNIKIEEDINSKDNIVIEYTKKVGKITIDLPKYKGLVNIKIDKDVEFNFDKINCPNANVEFSVGYYLEEFAENLEDDKKIRDKFFNEFKINIKELNCNTFNNNDFYYYLVDLAYIESKIKKDAYFFYIDNLIMNNKNPNYGLAWDMVKVKNLILDTQNPFDIHSGEFIHFKADKIKGDSNLILAKGYHKRKVGIIKHKKFLIAGTLRWFISHYDLEVKIESAKGIIVRKIEDNPDYVISVDKDSSGYNKAMKLSIPILSEDEIKFWLAADKII